MNTKILFAALLGLFLMSAYLWKETPVLEQYTCSCGSLEDMVKWAEGVERCVYKDTKGIKTIGIGFNLERGDAPRIIQSLGLNYNDVLNGRKCLTDSQISQIFNNDIQWAIEGAKASVPSYSQQSNCIQKTLVDMTFNMGKYSLKNWPNFVSQLAARNYSGASANVKSTAYCNQVKRRCDRNAKLISCG